MFVSIWYLDSIGQIFSCSLYMLSDMRFPSGEIQVFLLQKVGLAGFMHIFSRWGKVSLHNLCKHWLRPVHFTRPGCQAAPPLQCTAGRLASMISSLWSFAGYPGNWDQYTQHEYGTTSMHFLWILDIAKDER